MEVLAAVRALRKRKAAVGLQCAAMAVGLATLLICLYLLGMLYQRPGIPGAHCTAGIGRVVMDHGDGAWSTRFNAAQARLLRQALPQAVFRYAALALEVHSDRGTHRHSVTAIDPGLLQRLCVTRTSGQWPQSASRQAVVGDDFKPSQTLRIGIGEFRISAVTAGFRGLYGDKPSIYIPYAALPSTGFDMDEAGLASLNLPIDYSRLGRARTITRLNTMLAEHPGTFGAGARVDIQSILPLGAREAARLERFTTLFLGVASAFLLLGLLTVIAYQFGRIGALAQHLNLLRELGASRAATLRYSATEPLLIFMAALALAAPIAWLARPWLGTWLDLSSDVSVHAAWYAPAILLTITGGMIAALLIGGLARRLAEQGMSRALKRRVQHAFGYVVALQAAVCCLVLLPTIAAAMAYWLSVPRQRGYDVDNIRVYNPFLAVDMMPADFPVRLSSFLSMIEAQIGGQAAVGFSAFPLPGAGAIDSRVNYQGRNYTLDLNSVSASYFDVLKMRPLQGRFFQPHERPISAGDTPTVAVANRAAMQLLGIDQLPSSPIVIGKPTSYYHATVSVVGVVDEKTSGTNAPASPDRLRPALYLPWQMDVFQVFVRHPPDANLADVDHVMANAKDRYLPKWHMAERTYPPYSLRSLYDRATAPQRTTFTLFAALAAGAVLLTLLGIVGAGVMSLNLHSSSYAIRYTLGASRRNLLRLHLVQLAQPVLGGIAIAGGLGVLASRPLLAFMQLPVRLAPLLLATALGIVLLAGLLALLVSARSLMQLQLADTLRTE